LQAYTPMDYEEKEMDTLEVHIHEYRMLTDRIDTLLFALMNIKDECEQLSTTLVDEIYNIAMEALDDKLP